MAREKKTLIKALSFVLAFALMAGVGFQPARIYSAEVEVETKDATEITRESARLSGSYLFEVKDYDDDYYDDDDDDPVETVTRVVTEAGFMVDGAEMKAVISGSNFSLVLRELEPGTRYTYRAYIKYDRIYEDGDIVDDLMALGSPKEFTTLAYEPTIADPEITSSSGTSVTLSCGAFDVKEYTDVDELGFAYSLNSSMESLSYEPAEGITAPFSATISGLENGRTYYIWSYIEASTEGYAYTIIYSSGHVTYTPGNILISVVYRDASGTFCGAQSVSASEGAILTAANLVLPKGYELTNKAWTYTVKAAETINITVRPAVGENAFMSGIGGNNFGPELDISRGEVAQIMSTLSYKPGEALPAPLVFSDVPTGHKYKAAIDYCTSKGFLSGFPGGTFRPDESITRAQMTVILCKLYKLIGAASSNFDDVSADHWAYNYISLVNKHEMMFGYPNGTFMPEKPTSRAEVCTLFSNAEGRSLAPLGTAKFNDVPDTYWAYRYIMNAAVPTR